MQKTARSFLFGNLWPKLWLVLKISKVERARYRFLNVLCLYDQYEGKWEYGVNLLLFDRNKKVAGLGTCDRSYDWFWKSVKLTLLDIIFFDKWYLWFSWPRIHFDKVIQWFPDGNKWSMALYYKKTWECRDLFEKICRIWNYCWTKAVWLG